MIASRWIQYRPYWPLVVTFAAVLIAGFYLVFHTLSPLDYSEWRTGTVVYPLLLFYQNTAFILVAVSLIGLFGTLLHFLLLQVGCGSIILAVIAVAILTALTGATMGTILIFVLLMLAIFLLAHHKPVAGWAAFFMLLASAFSCFPGLSTVFGHVSHKTSIQFSEHTYHLALRNETDFDCNDHHYILYQCDSLGLICEPFYISEMYGECLGSRYREFPTRVEFAIDSTANELHLKFDGETVYTVQADDVQ